MKRVLGLTPALALAANNRFLVGVAVSALALGITATAAAAQETKSSAQAAPRDNKSTKEAEKLIGLALLKQKPEEKMAMYQQALQHVTEATEKEPHNARGWFLSGQVHAALGDVSAADASFSRAQELYPAYAEEIDAEREAAWLTEFNTAVEAIGAGQSEEAMRRFTRADSMYEKRPEAKLYLGLLYQEKGDTARAAPMLRAARAAAEGPLVAELKPEDQAQWKRYADMANLTLAQLPAGVGVALFESSRYEEAAAAFKEAAALNPHSRDYLYNLGQSLYAQAEQMEEARGSAKGADAEKLRVEAARVYEETAAALEKVRPVDPANEGLLLQLARTYRGLAETARDTVTRNRWQAKALEIVNAREQLTLEIGDVAVANQDGQTIVKGNLKNHRGAPGSAVRVRFTLIDLRGADLGASEVNVTAPAVDQAAPFELAIPVTGEIAGWRYELVR